MKLREIYIFIQLFIWIIIYLIISPWPLGWVSISIATLDQQQLWLFTTYEIIVKALMVYTYAHLALPVYLKKRKFSYLVFINLIYWLLFSIFESVVNEMYIRSIVQHSWLISWQNLIRMIPTHLFINLFLLTYANLTGFAYAWFKDERLRRILEREKLKAELSALKHQIHPHFLFNTLNSLYALAYENDDEDTAEGIAKLSHLMRYMIYEAKDEFVPLVKEISYIQNYIDLQKLRLGEESQVEFEVNGFPGNKKIAPLIFIPFIENAFKHGLSTIYPSFVKTGLEICETKLIFTTENTLSKSSIHTEKPYGGIGLTNVKKRLELLYPQSYELNMDTADDRYHVELILHL